MLEPLRQVALVPLAVAVSCVLGLAGCGTGGSLPFLPPDAQSTTVDAGPGDAHDSRIAADPVVDTSDGALDGLADATTAPAPRFQQIFDDVFTAHGCGNRDCHGKGAGNFTIDTPGSTYEALSRVSMTRACRGSARIVVGRPQESLLWRKVAGQAVEVCGNKMPPPNFRDGSPLPLAAVDLLTRWIRAGAPR